MKVQEPLLWMILGALIGSITFSIYSTEETAVVNGGGVHEGIKYELTCTYKNRTYKMVPLIATKGVKQK
jgi:hypothetical protein